MFESKPKTKKRASKKSKSPEVDPLVKAAEGFKALAEKMEEDQARYSNKSESNSTMTSRDFCYWLQGAIELGTAEGGLSKEQLGCIKKHLDMVFRHEIDPSFGSNREDLEKIHEGSKKPQPFPRYPRFDPHSKLMC